MDLDPSTNYSLEINYSNFLDISNSETITF